MKLNASCETPWRAASILARAKSNATWSPPCLGCEMEKSFVRRCSNRILHLMARFLPGSLSLRPFLHRLRGVTVGDGVFIGDDVYLDNEYPECIEIHENALISMRTLLIAHTRGPGRIILEK